MVNENANVTHEERQKILEAISKRKKPANTDFGVREKKHVSQEEYQQRMFDEIAKDRKDAAINKEARIARYVEIWNKSVGERFNKATTTNPQILDKSDRIKRGVGGHRTSVVLAGDLGIGKTWAAYGYLNDLVHQGLYNPAEIVHSTESTILGRIASAGFKRDDFFEELCKPMHKVFFIDDVGQAYYSDENKRHSVWFELINHIYANDLILVMTTNKKFLLNENGRFKTEALPNWIGDAAYDRVKNIVGNDGLIVPGEINRRPQVCDQRNKDSARQQ